MKDKASRGLVWLSRGCSVLVAVLLMQVGGASYAAAQATPNAAVQGAYELAMKCFVADSFASDTAKDANNQERASYYDGKAKVAFDKVVHLGRQLGYSNEQINGDFTMARHRELPKMFDETGYYRETAEMCQAYGL